MGRPGQGMFLFLTSSNYQTKFSPKLQVWVLKTGSRSVIFDLQKSLSHFRLHSLHQNTNRPTLQGWSDLLFFPIRKLLFFLISRLDFRKWSRHWKFFCFRDVENYWDLGFCSLDWKNVLAILPKIMVSVGNDQFWNRVIFQTTDWKPSISEFMEFFPFWKNLHRIASERPQLPKSAFPAQKLRGYFCHNWWLQFFYLDAN